MAPSLARPARTAAAVSMATTLAAASLVLAAAPSAVAAPAAPLPVISSTYSDDYAYEGNTSAAEILLRFDRSGDLSSTSSVKLTITDGTAVAPGDYSAAAYVSTLTFPAGEAFRYVRVKIKGDVVVEPDETFSFTLSQPVGATIGGGPSTVTIFNDDSNTPPSFFVDDAFGLEGDAGARGFVFTVLRYGSTAAPASVKVATQNGTATSPSDYQAKFPTRISFAVGQTTRIVTVSVKGDLAPESDEFFSLNLSSPVGATVSDGLGVGVIDNDDSSAVPSFTVHDSWTSDGYTASHPMTIVVHREGNLQGTSTVKASTVDGTATAPTDYVAKTTTLTFRPGETAKRFTVTVKRNTWDEPFEETFSIVLSSPTGGVIADGTGEMTIEDDGF